jgi:hypothetical protein
VSETHEQRTTHWDQCLAQAMAHADHLFERVKKGEINGSAVHNLMRGFLDQPAFYPEWRLELLRLSAKRWAL